MAKIAPAGPVYQAGTLSGNPLAVAGGSGDAAAPESAPGDLRAARAPRARAWSPGVPRRRDGQPRGLDVHLFLHRGAGDGLRIRQASDTARFAEYFHFMLERGIYLAPSQFEAAFVSAAHTDEDIERTLEASREALAQL